MARRRGTRNRKKRTEKAKQAEQARELETEEQQAGSLAGESTGTAVRNEQLSQSSGMAELEGNGTQKQPSRHKRHSSSNDKHQSGKNREGNSSEKSDKQKDDVEDPILREKGDSPYNAMTCRIGGGCQDCSGSDNDSDTIDTFGILVSDDNALKDEVDQSPRKIENTNNARKGCKESVGLFRHQTKKPQMSDTDRDDTDEAANGACGGILLKTRKMTRKKIKGNDKDRKSQERPAVSKTPEISPPSIQHQRQQLRQQLEEDRDMSCPKDDRPLMNHPRSSSKDSDNHQVERSATNETYDEYVLSQIRKARRKVGRLEMVHNNLLHSLRMCAARLIGVDSYHYFRDQRYDLQCHKPPAHLAASNSLATSLSPTAVPSVQFPSPPPHEWLQVELKKQPEDSCGRAQESLPPTSQAGWDLSLNEGVTKTVDDLLSSTGDAVKTVSGTCAPTVIKEESPHASSTEAPQEASKVHLPIILLSPKSQQEANRSWNNTAIRSLSSRSPSPHKMNVNLIREIKSLVSFSRQCCQTLCEKFNESISKSKDISKEAQDRTMSPRISKTYRINLKDSHHTVAVEDSQKTEYSNEAEENERCADEVDNRGNRYRRLHNSPALTAFSRNDSASGQTSNISEQSLVKTHSSTILCDSDTADESIQNNTLFNTVGILHIMALRNIQATLESAQKLVAELKQRHTDRATISVQNELPLDRYFPTQEQELTRGALRGYEDESLLLLELLTGAYNDVDGAIAYLMSFAASDRNTQTHQSIELGQRRNTNLTGSEVTDNISHSEPEINDQIFAPLEGQQLSPELTISGESSENACELSTRVLVHHGKPDELVKTVRSSTCHSETVMIKSIESASDQDLDIQLASPPEIQHLTSHGLVERATSSVETSETSRGGIETRPCASTEKQTRSTPNLDLVSDVEQDQLGVPNSDQRDEPNLSQRSVPTALCIQTQIDSFFQLLTSSDLSEQQLQNIVEGIKIARLEKEKLSIHSRQMEDKTDQSSQLQTNEVTQELKSEKDHRDEVDEQTRQLAMVQGDLQPHNVSTQASDKEKSKTGPKDLNSSTSNTYPKEDKSSEKCSKKNENEENGGNESQTLEGAVGQTRTADSGISPAANINNPTLGYDNMQQVVGNINVGLAGLFDERFPVQTNMPPSITRHARQLTSENAEDPNVPPRCTIPSESTVANYTSVERAIVDKRAQSQGSEAERNKSSVCEAQAVSGNSVLSSQYRERAGGAKNPSDSSASCTSKLSLGEFQAFQGDSCVRPKVRKEQPSSNQNSDSSSSSEASSPTKRTSGWSLNRQRHPSTALQRYRSNRDRDYENRHRPIHTPQEEFIPTTYSPQEEPIPKHARQEHPVPVHTGFISELDLNEMHSDIPGGGAESAAKDPSYVALETDEERYLGGSWMKRVRRYYNDRRSLKRRLEKSLSPLKKSDIMCPRCNRKFRWPHVLRCFHIYCYRCLLEMFDHVAKAVTCPMCACVSSVDTLDDLHLDYGKCRQMCEILQWPLICTMCTSGQDSEWYCHTCMHYLCHECQAEHARDLQTFSHRLTTDLKYTALPSGQLHPCCLRHRGEPLGNSWCSNCKEGLCRICLESGQHDGHKFIGGSTVREQLMAGCRRRIPHLQGLSDAMGNQLLMLNQARQWNENQQRQARHVVDAACRMYFDFIQTFKEDAMDEVEGEYTEVSTWLKEEWESLSQYQSELEHFRETAQRYANHPVPSEVVKIYPYLRKKYERLQNFLVNRPLIGQNVRLVASFDVSYPAFDAIMNRTFSSLQVTYRGNLDHLLELPIMREVRQERDLRNITHGLDERYRLEPSQGQHDEGATQAHGAVSVYPEFWRQTLSYAQAFAGNNNRGVHELAEPSGLAYLHDGTLAVCDSRNHRVVIYGEDGQFCRFFGQPSDGPPHRSRGAGQETTFHQRAAGRYFPYRIAQCPVTWNIIVLERIPSREIQIFKFDGAHVRSIGRSSLTHPRGMTVDDEGNILVLESRTMGVFIFRPSGAIVRQAFLVEHLDFPNDITTKLSKYIFISDNRRHCVKIFNYRLEYLGAVGNESLTYYPIGVSFNHLNQLVITDNHNTFNITTFNGEGGLLYGYRSRAKHANCLCVALHPNRLELAVTTRDCKILIFRYAPRSDTRGSDESHPSA